MDDSTSSSSESYYSESGDSLDYLLESMDEQIIDLNVVVKAQNKEIENLKNRTENLKKYYFFKLNRTY